MPAIVLTELHYLPGIPYFQQLLSADALLLDAHEHYQKQTFRNRALILTAQGVQALTVPVVDGARAAKVATSEIEIDYRQNWPHRHLRTLQTAYGASPYYGYYTDYFEDLIRQRHPTLWALNRALLALLLRCLRWPLPVLETQEYLPANGSAIQPSSHSTIDLRDTLTPQAPVPDRLALQPYPQVFGPAFAAGLSVLDLLFMQGPRAGQILAGRQLANS